MADKPPTSKDILETLQKVKRKFEIDDSPLSQSAKLLELYALRNELHDLKPGDVVEWKPGFRARSLEYGAPCVVVAVLDKPVICRPDSIMNPLWNAKFDLRVGWTDSDGDYAEFYVESWRLRPYVVEPLVHEQVH